jgi:stage II sporulation protein D
LLLAAVPLAAATTDIRVKLTQRDGGAVMAMPLDDYVAAVLAGESSVFRSDEALKAMAVAARTYAVRLRGRHAKEGFDFCATTHCQRVDLKAVSGRLQGIADETAGELLWYAGKPAFACYTRDCGGRTESAGAIWPDLDAPYLTSHDDPYCQRSGPLRWRWSGPAREILRALQQSGLRAPPSLDAIAVRQTTASGRARVLTLMGDGIAEPISASSFRFAVGRALGWDTLRSDLYRVTFTGGRARFEGSGAGHGAGLCQRGAEQMGAEGHSYREILRFYYPGAAVGLTARGIGWTRLSGEFVSLLTTHPNEDSSIIEKSERLTRALSERTGLRLPRRIEIRIYPDLDAFRNATGAPGSVAGQTRGSRIDLQPVAVLRSRNAFDSTLRHELLHVLVENRARPDLPIWFREGVVEYLDGSHRSARVNGLVSRYGAETVLTWLTRGLPAELNNSSSNSAPVKSK